MRFYRPFLPAVMLGLGVAIVVAKPIRMGVEMDSAPLSFADAEGRRTGFTVELWTELARVGDLEIEIVPNFWTNHLRDFHAGEIDVLANVIKTSERRPVMDFPIGHASVHGVIYQRRDQPPLGLSKNFAGKRIGTLNGTVDAAVKRNFLSVKATSGRASSSVNHFIAARMSRCQTGASAQGERSGSRSVARWFIMTRGRGLIRVRFLGFMTRAAWIQRFKRRYDHEKSAL